MLLVLGSSFFLGGLRHKARHAHATRPRQKRRREEKHSPLRSPRLSAPNGPLLCRRAARLRLTLPRSPFRFAPQTQRFNASGVMMNAGLLLLSCAALCLPAMLHASQTELHGTASELSLSRCAAGLLLIVYGAFLYFQMARIETRIPVLKPRPSHLCCAFVGTLLMRCCWWAGVAAALGLREPCVRSGTCFEAVCCANPTHSPTHSHFTPSPPLPRLAAGDTRVLLREDAR